MSYYKVLALDTEPFSTSPDPEFFYLSKEHETAMTNILIELRLKRGLSVILGDVGTGKTSLSRKLLRELRDREDILFHIILDPSFENEQTFLRSLIRNFEINEPHIHSVVLYYIILLAVLAGLKFRKTVKKQTFFFLT